MWLTKKNLIIIIIIFIIAITSYLFYILIPTTVGNVISKYIDTEEIIKITFIIDEVKKEDVPYHIKDKASIGFLHDYFYGINVNHAAAIPYFKETDNFIIYIYDKDGNIVRITSHDGYNGLYIYVQSKKWYKVKNYNNSNDIITYIKNITENE